MMTAITSFLLPHLLEIVFLVLSPVVAKVLLDVRTAIVGFLGERATNIVFEQVGQVMQRGIAKVRAENPNATVQTIADYAANYFRHNSPDLTRKIGASPEGLRQRALAEMAQMGIR